MLVRDGRCRPITTNEETPMTPKPVAALTALMLVLAVASHAAAEPIACKRQIARAADRFGAAKLKALQKCEDAVLIGKSAGPCPDAKASAAIGKASAKLQTAIAKRCGGADQTCSTTGDNDTLASIGWPGTCPNFEAGSCN